MSNAFRSQDHFKRESHHHYRQGAGLEPVFTEYSCVKVEGRDMYRLAEVDEMTSCSQCGITERSVLGKELQFIIAAFDAVAHATCYLPTELTLAGWAGLPG